MAQLIVRNLEEEVKNGLRRRASQHGRSVEEEVRDILRNAVKVDGKRQAGLGSELKKIFQGIGLKKDIPELKGSTPKTADFES
jgi:plasmid stability protein